MTDSPGVVTQPLDPGASGPAVVRSPVRAAPGDLETGTLLGDWSIECKIGEGGMGTVYAAVHAVIGKRAAIKVVRAELCATPAGSDRFVQEARVVNQIGHPNIVDIFHIGRLGDGRPYLVMELLRGRTLGDRLADGRLPPILAIDLLLQICDALAAAHGHGVVHRDLKPDNVFVSDTPGGPQVKLVDWGIAKLMDLRPTSATKTRSGTLIGTPQYISPEQARGKDVDARTDIYSLGAIAYELFLEEPPFTADNVADLIAMHLREAVPEPADVWPDIPVELERTMLAMLAKVPAERPTLDEIRTSLEAARAELSARAESRRIRRFASGSLAPPVSGLPRDPRATTGIGAVPIAVAAAASGAIAYASASGDVRIDPFDESAPIAPQPPPTLPGETRRPATGRWLLAAAALAAAAGAVAFVALRPDAGAVRSRAGQPPAVEEVATPVVVEAAPAVQPPAPSPAPVIALPALELRIAPRSATVRIDGVLVEVEAGRWGGELAAGAHEILVEAPGHRPQRRRVTLDQGTTSIAIELERARRAPARRAVPRRPVGEPVEDRLDPDGTIDPFR